MTIQIDEVQTEVQVDGDTGSAVPAPAEAEWDRLAQLRGLQAQLQADAARTRACGNDD